MLIVAVEAVEPTEPRTSAYISFIVGEPSPRYKFVENADVGETSVAPPPPDDISTNAETIPPTETGMTEAEVMSDLEQAGMVNKPEPAEDDKVREAKLLNSYAKEIGRMPDAKALNTWFSTNCLPMKKEFSEDGYWQLTKLVNDKLRSFKKK